MSDRLDMGLGAETVRPVFSPDPGDGHVAPRAVAGVEMLVEIVKRRDKHAPDMPIHTMMRLSLGVVDVSLPHERVSFSLRDDDGRAGPMSVGLAVDTDLPRGDVRGDHIVGHL